MCVDLMICCRLQSLRSAQSSANQKRVNHRHCCQQSSALAGFGMHEEHGVHGVHDVHVGCQHSGEREVKWHVLDGATHRKSFGGR